MNVVFKPKFNLLALAVILVDVIRFFLWKLTSRARGTISTAWPFLTRDSMMCKLSLA
jgi:hypothetical protein